jgi:hypothetical protein
MQICPVSLRSPPCGKEALWGHIPFSIDFPPLFGERDGKDTHTFIPCKENLARA